MKHKLLLKSLFLLCALIVGSGTSWAEETVYSTCKFGIGYGTSNNYTSTWTTTNGNFSWSVSNGNTNYVAKTPSSWDYVKFGRKNNASVGTITTSASYPVAITKVDVTITAVTTSNINSIKLYTSSNNSTWTEVGSYTVGTGTKSVSLQSPTANLYYKIEFDCASGGSNGLVSVSQVDYYYETGGGSLTTSDLAITGAPVALNFDLYNNSSAQAVSYTTSSTGAVTVSGGTGYVTTSVNTGTKTVTVTPTAVTPSAQTITISQEADATYAAGSATFTVTITNSTPVQLTPPTLTASPSNNTVTLEWEAISNASSYTIQYADNESFTGATTITNATSPKEITGLTNGTTYYFKAMSVGNGNNYLSSNYGDAVSAIPNNVVKITITQDQLTDFTNSYAWYDWTAGGVSGKAYAYKSSGMQFNSGKDGYWIYNTSAIPGTITSVKMVKASTGTDRNWTLSAGTSAISTPDDVDGNQIGDDPLTVGTSGTTWDVTDSYNYFCLIVSGGATVISSIEISYIPTPTITIESNSLTVPDYVAGTAEPDYATLTVNGSNLTADITLSLGNNSNFEMSTDLETWTKSLTLSETDGSVTDAEVAIRLKADLTKGEYNGTLTLSSTDATDVVINLTGSVTGQTYTVTYDANGGTGTMTDNNSYEEGDDVTLLDNIFSAPEGKMWSSWVVTNASSQSVTVTDGKFTMPASNVTVTAQWTVIPTYTAHFSINGFIDNDDDCTVAEDVAITFPSVTAPTGFTFMGWTTSTINGSQNAAPETLVTSANMGSADVNYYAVFAVGTESGEGTIELTNSTIQNNRTGKTSYGTYTIGDWSGKFMINKNGETYSLQIGRNASSSAGAYNSHLTTPECASNIKSITINTNNNTVSGRTFYLCSADNLGTASSGTYGSGSTSAANGSVTINITGNTKQFHIYPDGTAYIASVSLTYSTLSYSAYCTSIPTHETVSVTSAGYATYVSDHDLDYSNVDGLKAYKATVNGTAITFTKVTTVPAGEGVLIQANADSYNIPILVANQAAWAAEANAFIRGTGAAVATGSGPYNYILNKVNGVVGFYKANGQTVATNRAYLQSTAPVEQVALHLDGETTAIDALNDERESLYDGAIYDLSGRLITNGQSSMVNVQSLPKGIYIQNGKKFIVK